MYTPPKAQEYLGETLFALYQAKYPTIQPDTEVVKMDDRIFSVGYVDIIHTLTNAIGFKYYDPKMLYIAPEQFEWWAESKDASFFKLAYSPTTNRLYAFKM